MRRVGLVLLAFLAFLMGAPGQGFAEEVGPQPAPAGAADGQVISQSPFTWKGTSQGVTLVATITEPTADTLKQVFTAAAAGIAPYTITARSTIAGDVVTTTITDQMGNASTSTTAVVANCGKCTAVTTAAAGVSNSACAIGVGAGPAAQAVWCGAWYTLAAGASAAYCQNDPCGTQLDVHCTETVTTAKTGTTSVYFFNQLACDHEMETINMMVDLTENGNPLPGNPHYMTCYDTQQCQSNWQYTWKAGKCYQTHLQWHAYYRNPAGALEGYNGDRWSNSTCY